MIAFAKAHAYGNDFLYIRRADVAGLDGAALARELCDRHLGIGADGLVLYDPTPAGATMTLWNADGGEAEVSGNGVRGLGAILLDGETHDRELTIVTGAGEKRLAPLGRSGSRQMFRSAMGMPTSLREAAIPVDDEQVRAVLLNMGNPQCVLLEPPPSDARFERLGRALERHPMFPAGTNVEFAFVETPALVRIRIWERGVGPTQSSGTGSCASLVAAAAYGGASRDARVVAPGGEQRVEWLPDGVYLTGWAEVVCEGRWLPQFPRTAR